MESESWTLPERYTGTFTLSFVDETFHGLVVVMKRHTIEGVRAAFKALTIQIGDLREGKLTQKQWKTIETALTQFASHLVSWNLTIDGVPVPASRAGVRSVDIVFVMQLYIVWLKLLLEAAAQQAELLAADVFNTDEIPMQDIGETDG